MKTKSIALAVILLLILIPFVVWRIWVGYQHHAAADYISAMVQSVSSHSADYKNEHSTQDGRLPDEMPDGKERPMKSTFYTFTMTDIDGAPVSLAQYQGKVVLVVNVASKCGFTRQYAGLQALYEKYQEQGFVVLGFPANNFLGQEPGTDAEIKAFCTAEFNVTFPMFSKISVKGEDIHPLYRYLTDPEQSGEFAAAIAWNFNKFLIDKNGRTVNYFGSRVDPLDPGMTDAIEEALRQNEP